MKKIFCYLIILYVLIISIPCIATQPIGINIYENIYDFVYVCDNGGIVTVIDDIILSHDYHHEWIIYDELVSFSEDIVVTYCETDDSLVFTTKSGDMYVLEDIYSCNLFLGGKCSVISTDGDYGLINTAGEYLLDCEYDYIQYDESDIFFVLQDTTWQLAHLENGVVNVQPFAVDNICDPRKDSTLQNVIASDGRYYGILTSNNKPLVDFKYEAIYDLTNGLYAGIVGDKTELISADGTVTATLDEEILGSYSEGKIPCRMNDQFGYINCDGKIVSEVTVSDVGMIYPFYEGLAVIQFTDGGYTFINEYGDYACDYVWDYAGQFARGYALVMEVVFDGEESVRRWKIIDHEFDTVEQLTADVYMSGVDDHSTDFTNGYIRTIDYSTDKMGFAYTENVYNSYDCSISGHVSSELKIIDETAESGAYTACIKCGEIINAATDDGANSDREDSEAEIENSTDNGRTDSGDSERSIFDLQSVIAIGSTIAGAGIIFGFIIAFFARVGKRK